MSNSVSQRVRDNVLPFSVEELDVEIALKRYLRGCKDGQEVYGHLGNLDRNTDQITDQVNKQVIINDRLIKGINNVTTSLRQTQKRVESAMNVLGLQATKPIAEAMVLQSAVV